VVGYLIPGEFSVVFFALVIGMFWS